jgi:hypothetical protein
MQVVEVAGFTMGLDLVLVAQAEEEQAVLHLAQLA